MRTATLFIGLGLASVVGADDCLHHRTERYSVASVLPQIVVAALKGAVDETVDNERAAVRWITGSELPCQNCTRFLRYRIDQDPNGGWVEVHTFICYWDS